ncbi:hypothetical protein K466DRAFT_559944 [Polyporus arcularius HHB13444]|uniref:Uncharacterized protein n=1 Tax=Polyporus arcularius HHB13444 TaxID=1314778 RepID=A0A5C3NQR7_9APHY|nr:hypothetical protein K466DRAFT_559944 [Polyporus arcularius HHB13444]
MVKDLKEHLNEAELKAQRSEKRMACLEHSLSAAQDQKRTTAVLLETRTAELRDAQSYLNMVDDVPDREVLRIIEKLNSMIFQTAATASDTFQGRYQNPQSPEAEETGRQLVERSGFSTQLRTALRSVNHNDDAILVQMALQGAMGSYTGFLCITWDFGAGKGFESVYARVRKQEPQSVSGRWRAMSRTHLKVLLGDEQELQLWGEAGLAGKLTDILLICGVPGTRRRLLAEVRSTFSESLHEIVRLALHFQRVTGESIVSRDLSAVVAKPGDLFDPERMVDEWADPKSIYHVVQSPPVLCTTQLGLLRQETQHCTTSGGAGGTSLVVSSTLLLKPHVILVTMLDDLKQPQEGGRAHASGDALR